MYPLVVLAVLVLIGGGSVKLLDHFNSEQASAKQIFGKFITEVTCSCPEATRVFADMTKLDAETSKCTAHVDAAGEPMECPVPSRTDVLKAFIAAVGFSCKDLSNLRRLTGLSAHIYSFILNFSAVPADPCSR